MTWLQAFGLSFLIGGCGFWGATALPWAPAIAGPCTIILIAIVLQEDRRNVNVVLERPSFGIPSLLAPYPCDLCGEPVAFSEGYAITFPTGRRDDDDLPEIVLVPGTYHRDCCKAARQRAKIVHAVTTFLIVSATPC